MTELVIVGRYPFPGRKLEGMVQRIANIDSQLEGYPRTYLNLYGFKQFRMTKSQYNNVEIYTASFLNFFTIVNILKEAKFIYVHSIYFYALILLPLLFVNKKVRIILDAHGVVPEEIGHSGKPLFMHFMNLIERAAFSRVAMVICVTRRMELFFRTKYPKSEANFLYLPIFTAQVCLPADQTQSRRLRNSLGIPETAIIALYSGGLQPWQNVDKMVEAVGNLMNCEDFWFIFLTNESDLLTKKVEEILGHKPARMLITYATPNDLRNFYDLADFGFLLRDDHILNRVANPTKLVEYLYFGIRPIVLCADIGDFLRMRYEYVTLTSFCAPILKPSKSKINRRIALRLLKDAKSGNICNYIPKPLS